MQQFAKIKNRSLEEGDVKQIGGKNLIGNSGSLILIKITNFQLVKSSYGFPQCVRSNAKCSFYSTVERPERDAAGNIVLATKGKGKGKPVPDSALRDTENVPLSEDVETYFKREVLPHAPDAWIDHDKTKIGYEIPFNRHFYVFKPPRPLGEIDAELKGVTDRILTMIGGLTA